MKSSFFAITLAISGLAFADTITMSPGSSITVQPSQATQISCSGSSNKPICSIRVTNGELCVTLGGSDLHCYYGTYQDSSAPALVDIKALRDSGICQ